MNKENKWFDVVIPILKPTEDRQAQEMGYSVGTLIVATYISDLMIAGIYEEGPSI